MKPKDLEAAFEKAWESQQGALFLKRDNHGLEWRKALAKYFFMLGQDSIATDWFEKACEILRRKE